jgi:hypothetical protein
MCHEVDVLNSRGQRPRNGQSNVAAPIDPWALPTAIKSVRCADALVRIIFLPATESPPASRHLSRLQP